MQRSGGTSRVHGDVCAIRIIGCYFFYAMNVNECMNVTRKQVKEKHT